MACPRHCADWITLRRLQWTGRHEAATDIADSLAARHVRRSCRGHHCESRWGIRLSALPRGWAPDRELLPVALPRLCRQHNHCPLSGWPDARDPSRAHGRGHLPSRESVVQESDPKGHRLLPSTFPWWIWRRLALLACRSRRVACRPSHRRLGPLLALGLRGHESNLGQLRRCDDCGLHASFATTGSNSDTGSNADTSSSAYPCAEPARTISVSASDMLLEQVG